MRCSEVVTLCHAQITQLHTTELKALSSHSSHDLISDDVH